MYRKGLYLKRLSNKNFKFVDPHPAGSNAVHKIMMLLSCILNTAWDEWHAAGFKEGDSNSLVVEVHACNVYTDFIEESLAIIVWPLKHQSAPAPLRPHGHHLALRLLAQIMF